MNDDLPLLGEPPAIELANTWYGAGDEAADYLAEPEVAQRWVAAVLQGAPAGDLVGLRALRDATRTLLAARCDGIPLDPRAVEVVNAHAARACAHVALVVAEGAASSRVSFRGDAAARLATSCVEVLTGPDPLRRCEGPGCTMFFAQGHGRRRFCHDGCSHRARQRRYLRSHR
jgi:predicted RNA-binding Zn ribbon-like protein